MLIAYLLGAAVLSYLIGAIPFSYLIPKVFYGVDVLEVGSGNIGATNVVRAVGKAPGILCFVLDMLKGFGPAFGLQFVPGIPHYLPIVAASGAIVGHARSIFLGGKGGKAVATGVGTILALNPLVGLAALVLWGLTFQLTKIVSIASVTAALALPGLMMGIPRPQGGLNPAIYVAFAMAAGFYVIIRHRENIKRIMDGTEPRFGGPK